MGSSLHLSFKLRLKKRFMLNGTIPALRWLPIVFWPRAGWFRISHDVASFKKCTRESRTGSRSKMSTNMTSKFVFRKNCVNFLFLRNVYRINRRPYLFLRDIKERRACYVGVPFKETDFYDRHASNSHGSQQGLPYVFAVLGVVCAAGANSEDTREQESAISAINQDVTPPISRHFSVRRVNGRYGNRKPKKILVP